MGSLIWNSSFKCPTVSLESVLHVSVLTPTSRARERPVRIASEGKVNGFFDEDVVESF